MSSDSSLDLPAPPSPVLGYKEPPTVKTEAVVVDSYVEEQPEGTTQPPIVQTETKTIIYETSTETPSEEPEITMHEGETQRELVSSQIISSETEYTVTTTEITKVVRGSVSETMVEKQMISTGDSAVDNPTTRRWRK
uniref:Band 4.1 C-terminal domain-containing protein n=1 Tax=Ciona savignyi TaxID=51511 RepID=H2YB46_CIOSA